MIKVSLVECKSYEDAEKAIKKSLGLIGGINKFVKKGDKVLLKANMLIAKPPEAAATTNPKIIEAVIKEVRKAGGRPFVGDGTPLERINSIGEKSGISEVCKKLKVPLIELDDPVENRKIRHFMVSNKLKEFDVIINLPKIKTHGLVTYTGGVKNLFGCIPGTFKASMHLKTPRPEEFAAMLIDLYTLIKPKLTIMDGVWGMEGQGPGNGKPRKFNVVLASENALAIDTVVTNMLGINKNVPVQKAAEKRKLPGATIKEIRLIGENLEKFKISDLKLPFVYTSKIPPFMIVLAKKYLLVRKPAVNQNVCIRCGDCFRICPAKAITMQPYPKFNYGKCIRCFCCDEVCPKKAIIIKESKLLKIYKKVRKNHQNKD